MPQKPLTPEQYDLLRMRDPREGLEPEEQDENKPRTYRSTPMRIGATATRLGGGLISGLVGAVPSFVTTPAAAAIAGGAEAAAQKLESPDPLDYSSIITEGGIGAIPLSKIYKVLKVGGSVGKQIATNVLRGAIFQEGGNMLRRYNSEGNPLPQSKSETLWDLGTMGVGGLMGLGGRKALNAKIAAEEAAKPKGFDQRAAEAAIDEIVGANRYKPIDPANDATLPGAVVNNVANNVGGRVSRGPAWDPKNVLPAVDKQGIPHPVAKPPQRGLTIGAPNKAYIKPEPIPDLPLKADNVRGQNGRVMTEPAPPSGLEDEITMLARTRVPKIKPEELDAKGLLVKGAGPETVKMNADFEAKKAVEMAKLRRDVNSKIRAAEQKQLAKEEAADLQALRKADSDRKAANTVQEGVINADQTEYQKIAAQLEKNRQADATRHASDISKTEAGIKALEDEAKIKEFRADPDVKAGPESVTETIKSGDQTKRQTFRVKEDDAAGVPTDDFSVDPNKGKPSSSNVKLTLDDIPITDANKVASSAYGTSNKAYEAGAGTGKRFKLVRQDNLPGKNKWRVIFEKDAPPEPPTEPPVPPAPVAPKKGPKGPKGGGGTGAAQANRTKSGGVIPVKPTQAPKASAEPVAAPITPVPEPVKAQPTPVKMQDPNGPLSAYKPGYKEAVEMRQAARSGDIIDGNTPIATAKPVERVIPGKGGVAVKEPPAQAKPEKTIKGFDSAGYPTTSASKVAKPVTKEPPAPTVVPKSEAAKMTPEELDAAVAKELEGWSETELKRAKFGTRNERFIKAVDTELARKQMAKVTGTKPENTTIVKETPKTNWDNYKPDPVRSSTERGGAVVIGQSKPVTPQIEAPAGSTPLGIKPEAPKAVEPSKTKLISERGFPLHNGEELSWSTSVYNTWNEKSAGYPKIKAIIRSLGDIPDGALAKERAEALKASASKEWSAAIDAELAKRTDIPAGDTIHALGKKLKSANTAEAKDAADEIIARFKAKEANPEAHKTLDQYEYKAQAEAYLKRLEEAKPKPRKFETVKLDLSGAKDSKEVTNRIVVELEKYKQRIVKAAENIGVDEKGNKTGYVKQPDLVIEVPNGPTYTIAENQVDGAIERFTKGLTRKGYEYGNAGTIKPDNALKGIVDEYPKRPVGLRVAGDKLAESKARVEAARPGAQERVKADAKKYLATRTPEEVDAAKARVAASKAKSATPANIPDEKVTSKPINELYQDMMSADKAYGDLKDKVRAGTATREELKAAGERLGRARHAHGQAVKAAEDAGEQIPTYSKPVVKPTMPKGKGPLSSDITALPPAEQEAKLKEVVQKFKKGKRKGFTDETGAITTHGLAQLGLTGVGALYGAHENPDNPVLGAILGGAAGLGTGLFAPAAFRAAQELVAGDKDGAKKLAEFVVDKANTLKEMAPDYQRFSYLSKPDGLMINGFVGPFGSLFMGAVERGLSGDPRGWKALQGAYKFFTDYPAAFREAGERIADVNERVGMTRAGPEWFQKTSGFPAKVLTGGDIAARKVLMDAGFTEAEARAFNLTSEPIGGYGKSMSNASKTKGNNNEPSWTLRMMLPFYRTNVNQLEQNFIRMPFIGPILRHHWKMAPRSMRESIVQQGLTLGMGTASYALGAVTPEEQQRATIKFLNNFGGVYGTSMSLAFMAGAAAQKGEPAYKQFTIPASRLLKDGVALPTLDTAFDLLKTFNATFDNKKSTHPELPYGVVPPFLSSKQRFSVPTIMRDPKGVGTDMLNRIKMDPTSDSKVTKREYSVFAPFVANPEMKKEPHTLSPGQRALKRQQEKMKAIRDAQKDRLKR